MNSNCLKFPASRSVLAAGIAVSFLVGGCSTIKGWMGFNQER